MVAAALAGTTSYLQVSAHVCSVYMFLPFPTPFTYPSKLLTSWLHLPHSVAHACLAVESSSWL